MKRTHMRTHPHAQLQLKLQFAATETKSSGWGRTPRPLLGHRRRLSVHLHLRHSRRPPRRGSLNQQQQQHQDHQQQQQQRQQQHANPKTLKPSTGLPHPTNAVPCRTTGRPEQGWKAPLMHTHKHRQER
ncbi:hypothetical protein PLESTB_000102600 [Pleodorina starrii]|uniref:Uncharacterized protein n=1 Tax=Pleodorina starrii TaxID=330485 RepID=A0A9W6EXX8_9CHLO|nr:hypothetical protein PLESTB_000102600 [Pleodorina starrii]GLC71801.1 hypothetical protein PLESTF_001168400 [Pleodorina starrii]